VKPSCELSEIVSRHEDDFIKKHNPLLLHRKVLRAIRICRTSELGGHKDNCDTCNHVRISYNSCRNRHCPKCQATNRERWILERKQNLLNCSYFHVVFTMPQELNSYCLKYPKQLYNMLFFCAKETMLAFGNDKKHLGAELGIIAILHTWGQTLQLHPHLHMIVPGGGICENNTWKNSRAQNNFLFPVKALSKVFRGKFMQVFSEFLAQENIQITGNLKRTLYNLSWNVYAKKPFLGASQVIEYLGRYTHKIAISNHRILKVEDSKVTFKYTDYKHGSAKKVMVLDATEFLRRFCMHILPPRFRKIRHYGFLANRNKKKLRFLQFSQGIIPKEQTKISYKEIAKNYLGFDVDQCPCCKEGRMIRVMSFSANAPPLKASIRFENIR
jgi:hypothetical protein